MKKQALLLSAFFILIANGWAQNPCEKYGPFDAKMYTSFLEAVKEKEVVSGGSDKEYLESKLIASQDLLDVLDATQGDEKDIEYIWEFSKLGCFLK